MHKLNLTEWIIVIVAALYLVYDWIKYFKFSSNLSRSIKGIKLKQYSTPYHSIEKLYISYKTLSKDQLAATKLYIKSNDFNNNLYSQVVDLMAKLFFSIFFSVFGLLAAMMTLNINFFTSNKDQITNWLEKVTDSFGVLNGILQNLNTVLAFAVALFLVALNHTVLLKLKRDKQLTHLNIIEEIERSDKK